MSDPDDDGLVVSVVIAAKVDGDIGIELRNDDGVWEIERLDGAAQHVMVDGVPLDELTDSVGTK